MKSSHNTKKNHTFSPTVISSQKQFCVVCSLLANTVSAVSLAMRVQRICMVRTPRSQVSTQEIDLPAAQV